MFWLLVLFSIISLAYYVLIKPLEYQISKGLTQPKAITLWTESVREIFQLAPVADIVTSVYNSIGEHRYGVWCQFLKPSLLIKDLDLIKQITVKDFDHFVDHDLFVPEENEPLLGKNLLSLKGDKWKRMRAALSPAFTSSKMRGMFSLINECAKQFVDFFKDGSTEIVTVDFKDAFKRYANDVIALTAFGVSCDSLKNRENEFYVRGDQATNFKGLWKNMKQIFVYIAPKLAKLFGVQLFNKHASNFFRRLVKTNIETREKNGIFRPDMIQLLMEARKGKLKYEQQSNDVVDTEFAMIDESAVRKEETYRSKLLSDDGVTAQALIFFLAGFVSSSSFMCFAAYELAINPDIQKRLQDEVDDTLRDCNGSLRYEGLLKMKYMDMVTSETLRKWPTANVINRVCVKPYTIRPTKNGESPVHLKVGDVVWIPVYPLHRDERLYSEPERFDPERFSDDNKTRIKPYSYIPFGAGPRNCIGSRFALIEAKTVLFYLLSSFEIVVVEKSQVPMKLTKTTFNVAVEEPFWFGLKPRAIAI